MTNQKLKRSLEKFEKKHWKEMQRYLLWGVFEPRLFLTPLGSMYRCWKFRGGTYDIEYIEIYIFGLRIARFQL